MTVEGPKMDVQVQQEAAVTTYLQTLLFDIGSEQTAPQVAKQPVLPSWAHGVFPCLMWEAAGVCLAVPLAEMRAVVPAVAALHPINDASPWIAGELIHDGRRVRVVDMAAWIWGRPVPPVPSPSAMRIALLGPGDWALLCPDSELQQLHGVDVRWRTAATRRRWLAGTVSGPRCAVLDVGVLVDMLEAGRAGS